MIYLILIAIAFILLLSCYLYYSFLTVTLNKPFREINYFKFLFSSNAIDSFFLFRDSEDGVITTYTKTRDLYFLYKELKPFEFMLAKLHLKERNSKNSYLNNSIELLIKLVVTISVTLVTVTVTISIALLGFEERNTALKEADYFGWTANIEKILQTLQTGLESIGSLSFICLSIFIFALSFTLLDTLKESQIKRHCLIVEQIEQERKTS